MSFLQYPVRLLLKGNRGLTGTIHIAEGESLCEFLGSKLSFLNLTDVRWEGSGQQEDALPHISVQLGQIIWVEPEDPALQLSTASLPAQKGRKVDLRVDGGIRLRVRLNVAEETRMSDYLEVRPSFIALWAVEVEGRNAAVDRAALNRSAIHVIRELEETDPRTNR